MWGLCPSDFGRMTPRHQRDLTRYECAREYLKSQESNSTAAVWIALALLGLGFPLLYLGWDSNLNPPKIPNLILIAIGFIGVLGTGAPLLLWGIMKSRKTKPALARVKLLIYALLLQYTSRDPEALKKCLGVREYLEVLHSRGELEENSILSQIEMPRDLLKVAVKGSTISVHTYRCGICHKEVRKDPMEGGNLYCLVCLTLLCPDHNLCGLCPEHFARLPPECQGEAQTHGQILKDSPRKLYIWNRTYVFGGYLPIILAVEVLCAGALGNLTLSLTILLITTVISTVIIIIAKKKHHQALQQRDHAQQEILALVQQFSTLSEDLESTP